MYCRYCHMKVKPEKMSPIIGMPLKGVAPQLSTIRVALNCSWYWVPLMDGPFDTVSVPGNAKPITRPTDRLMIKNPSNNSHCARVV